MLQITWQSTLTLQPKSQSKSTSIPKAKDYFVKLQWDKADPVLYHRILSGLLFQLTIAMRTFPSIAKKPSMRDVDLAPKGLADTSCVLYVDPSIGQSILMCHTKPGLYVTNQRGRRLDT